MVFPFESVSTILAEREMFSGRPPFAENRDVSGPEDGHGSVYFCWSRVGFVSSICPVAELRDCEENSECCDHQKGTAFERNRFNARKLRTFATESL